MRLLTNPGSNLRAEILAAYEIALAAQSIVVDGTPYETRSPIPLGLVDDWGRTAKVHPYVVGTTAAETVEGVSGTIYPLPIGNITNIDLFVCCGASILLYFFSLFMGKLKIGRAEGLFLLICYFLYLGFQISQLDN